MKNRTSNQFVAHSLAMAMIALGIFAMPTQATADLILNGSFELGLSNIGSFTTLDSPDSSSITDWTVSAGSVDYIGTYWNASDGVRSLDMDGVTAGTISQTIGTVVGQTYQVLFDISGNADGPPTTKTLGIVASVNAGSNTYTYTLPGGTDGNHNLLWVTEAFVFTANTNLTTLSFSSLDNNPDSITAFGPALDNVRMNAIPESSSIVIWSLLGGVGIVMCGRRNRLA
jgi:choice-of-anchor C domain-containing protein